MLALSELLAQLKQLGLIDISPERREVARPLRPWLAQAEVAPAAAAQIEARLRAELNGGEPTGFQPHQHDGELWFVQVWASVAGPQAG